MEEVCYRKIPKSILNEWIRLINLHDAEGLAKLYHKDAINLQVAIGKPLTGQSEILADFRSFFENIPDTYTKVENLFEDGGWAILEWSGGGTFQPTQKKFKLNGCGFFRILEGKILFQRGNWDKHTWFSQVDLPMNPANRIF